MNLIQFLKFCFKFFNTRKYTINNDVLIKIHYYTKYIKIKILLKIRYSINNDIVEINYEYTKYR